MKPIPSEIGFRLRTLRRSRQQTQNYLAARCRRDGFPVTRQMIAHYERGCAEVPARFIPIIARTLGIEIVQLVPPLNTKPATIKARREKPERAPTAQPKNLTGPRIRMFRRQERWTQRDLTLKLRRTGLSITRDIIANIETRRCSVTDHQIFSFAKVFQVSSDVLFSGGKNAVNAQVKPTCKNRNPMKTTNPWDETDNKKPYGFQISEKLLLVKLRLQKITFSSPP